MTFVRAAAFAVVLLVVTSLTGFPRVTWSGQDADVDRAIKPGDDFYRYANSPWLATIKIPAGQTSYDNRALLFEKAGQQVRALIKDASATQAAKGSVEQKVNDYYASFLDQDAIESQALEPLREEISKISAIGDKTALSAYLGSTLNSEVDGLIAN